MFGIKAGVKIHKKKKMQKEGQQQHEEEEKEKQEQQRQAEEQKKEMARMKAELDQLKQAQGGHVQQMPK